MNIDKSLTFLLTQITNPFRNQLDKYLKEIGLHGGQVFVLIALWKEDGQSQTSVAQKLGLSAPTINKMVKSLATNNFLSCKSCEIDGRVMRVYLTKKGVECKSYVEAQWQKMETEFFLNLTDTEKLIFMQVLEKLKTSPSL